MQNTPAIFRKLQHLWSGSDLMHMHAWRARRALMLGSAAMVSIGLAWGASFALLGNWPIVLLDAVLVLGGMVTLGLISKAKPEWVAIVPVITLLLLIFTIGWIFDSPSAQSPRTTQLYLLPLCVVAMIAFRSASPWLRYGLPGICLLAFAFLSLGYASPLPQYALPESVKAYGAPIQVLAALSLLYFMLQIMQHDAIARSALEDELQQALDRSEFCLYYQPQLDVQGRVIAAEALIRWQHPERGLVMPGHFIEKAEESGLMLPIGAWVAKQACAQLQSWSHMPGLQDLRLAINISQLQIQQKDFVPHVKSLQTQYGIQPGKLELELTESMLAYDIQDVIQKMKELHQVGVSFSLDDFGTGYSSLNHLKSLPLHQLKIDQSFVKDVLNTPSDASIVKTMVALGHNLGMTVIAEGVETAEQRQFLADSGCDLFQGYLFSQAIPLDAFNDYVRATNTPHLAVA